MNQFGEEFYSLYSQNHDHEYFIDYTIDLGDEEFAIVEFVPINSILNKYLVLYLAQQHIHLLLL